MKKVTGVGGIFLKCNKPDDMREWYAKNLGLVTNQYGSLFEFRNTDNPEEKQYLQWSTMSEDSKHFEPSKKQFMVNYRVEDLKALFEELKSAGVEVIGEMEEYEYGKFAWIMDPEGNKIELWEPVDKVFTDLYKNETTH